MTIEDYIKIIKNWLYKGTNGLTNTELGYMEGWFHKTDKEAFEVAIETMRKYQKIVDMVSLNDEEFKQCGLKELKEILEVIADGDEE